MKPKQTNWHFARPELANAYLDLFEIGLTSARGLFARRRMGKTEFLKKDLIPAAEKRNYKVVYANLWDLEIDPATALLSEFYKVVEPKGFNKILANFKFPINKVKAFGKIPGLVEGSLEAEVTTRKKLTGSLLMEAMNIFDQKKFQMILIIDEAQVLAYEENAHFSHALRAALDIRKERIKVIFAGSSESTLRRMFGVSSEPFYNWAPLEPFELLGSNFVCAIVEHANSISKFPLAIDDALNAFIQLKNTPECFRRYIEQYLTHPLDGSLTALDATKNKVFNEESFKRQWDALLAADQVILSMIANGSTDLYGKSSMQKLGLSLGVGDSINKNTINNALRRLLNKQILTKMEYGVYQFEDEAFADWIKYID